MYMFQKFLNFIGFEKVKAAVIGRWRWRRPGTNSIPEVKPSITQPKSVEYFLNDPTTPDLKKTLTLPTPPVTSPFTVKGYKGGGFQLGTAENQAASVFVTLANTLTYYNSKNGKPIPKWSGTANLKAFPRAGVDLNAFYDRHSLQFFYASNRRFGTVYAADSTDIVSHELGHAILDSFRPEFWSAASLEIAAFHECFGDFTAMMHIMTYDEVINKAIAETGGDLSKENVIARMAEQFGLAISKLVQNTNPNYLRCAVNNFKYVNPGTLPADAPDSQLAAEPHNFSRIFTGALYDVFVMMYNDFKTTGANSMNAIKQAHDLIATYVLKAIQNAPVNVKFFESMARTMLWVDVTINNRKFHDRMQTIFLNRNLVSNQLMMLSAPKCETEEPIIRVQSMMNVKLGDHLIRAQSDNQLYEVELEIPTEHAYLYDNDKNLYDTMLVSNDESLSGAQDMISYLHQTNGVSDDSKTPFEIKDGKLVRSHIVCSCKR